MSGRTGHPVAQRRPAAQLRGRLPRREPAGRQAPARSRHQHHRRRPAPGRHLPQSRHLSEHLLHRSEQRPPQRSQDPVRDSRRGRHADLRAAHRAAEPESGGRAEGGIHGPGRSRARRADPADARHRAQPVDDESARPAVPALLRRRRQGPHPAAQRSGSRRARQRAGAAQPAAADEDDGHHRRRPGRDAAGEPAHGEHARHPRRADHAGVVRRVRADCHRRRAAALFRRPAPARGSRHRSPPGAARLQRGVQGYPRRLRLDLHHPDRAPARRRRQHLGAHGHGDALRDQVRHAVLRASHQSRRPRGVHLPVSARRCRADPQDGRRGNHAGAARLRQPGESGRADARPGVLRLHRRSPARGLHPLHRRLLPAARRRQVDDHRRRGRHHAGDQREEPRLLAQRRRVREALVRGDRQRRRTPRDGQGGRPDGALPGEIRTARGTGHHRAHLGDGRAVPAGAGGEAAKEALAR